MRVCIKCGEGVADARASLGYDTCLPCGEVYARKRKHTIVPLNKSNYVVISDPSILKQLNPKQNRT